MVVCRVQRTLVWALKFGAAALGLRFPMGETFKLTDEWGRGSACRAFLASGLALMISPPLGR
jgi:hypothetical protein